MFAIEQVGRQPHEKMLTKEQGCQIKLERAQWMRQSHSMLGIMSHCTYVHIHTQTHGTVKVGRYVFEVLNYASHSGVQNVPFFSRSPVATARNVALSRPSKYHT